MSNKLARMSGAAGKRLLLIKKIDHSLSPLSPFPTSAAKDYAEYFSNTYSLATTHNNQPLISVDYHSLTSSFLLKSNKDITEDNQPLKHELLFIAEHLEFVPFDTKQAFVLSMLPSILHRANCLMKARKLQLLIETELVSKFGFKNVSQILNFE